MSRQPINSTFSKQQKRLVRATFKKGFVSAVYVNSNTADVSFADNPNTVMRNIPVADSVDIVALAAIVTPSHGTPYQTGKGVRCKVDIFDETNPTDCVVAFTY